MAEVSRMENNPENTLSPQIPATAEPLVAAPEALLPEHSSVATPAGNSQLNRSAEAFGRGVGTAVAGVRNLPHQLDRLRSRIHLVGSRDDSADLTGHGGDVAGEWRDAVESGFSEAAESARRYRGMFAEQASQRMQELRWLGERRFFALRRELRHRLDKVRRTSAEEPLKFVAGCVVAAFAMGVVVRLWRSNDE